MPTRERRLDHGNRASNRILASVGEEFRQARLAAGLSQAAVASASSLSTTQISRIERAKLSSATVNQAARLASVLGLDLSVKLYPGGQPLRDHAHLELCRR